MTVLSGFTSRLTNCTASKRDQFLHAGISSSCPARPPQRCVIPIAVSARPASGGRGSPATDFLADSRLARPWRALHDD